MDDHGDPIGKLGIQRERVHSILSLEDVQRFDFKFLRLKNYWGNDSNWTGPFSKNSDELDKYKNLREDLNRKYPADTQSVYFIKYENFVKEFSKIVVLKTFSESVWQQYSTRSVWIPGQLGGVPQSLDAIYPEAQRMKRKTVQMDSDYLWFGNPQFWLQVRKRTKVYICISQVDQASLGQTRSYLETDFYIF